MRKIINISIWLICFSLSLTAQKKYIYQDSALIPETQDQPAVAAPVEDEEVYTGESTVDAGPDTTVYFFRYSLPQDSVKSWSRGKGLEYMAYLDSALKAQRGKQKPERRQTRTIETSEPGILSGIFASGIFQVIMWVIAGGFILYILYRLFLVDGAFSRTKKAQETIEPEVTEEEEITRPDELDMKIRQAVADGNFRLAVRYQYLKTLHKLAGQEKIELAADKTNYQYVRELKDYNQQNEFAALTLNYEYVWYGEFRIGKEIYDRIATGFSAFNQKW